MNSLAKPLLSGVALCALATVPAVASNGPAFHVQALRRGHVVNKTNMQNQKAQHITYTFGVYTYVSASDLYKTIPLAGTFYKWCSTSSCFGPEPRQKIKAPKKSKYAKIGTATETYTFSVGPRVFYGDTYKLKDAAGEGQTDTFVSSLYAWFTDNNSKYKGTLNLEVSVAIGS
jgi:hypothetical protein